MTKRTAPSIPVNLLPYDLQVVARYHSDDFRNLDWLHEFARFRDLWNERTSDLVGRQHPMEDWVVRQRKAYRIKSMPDWRADLFLSINFPLRAPRLEMAPTDLYYAQQLIDFERVYGHYAPTTSFGGTGLARWVRLMRESGGTSGLISGTSESAIAAARMLKAALPDFSWENTQKETHNLNAGLSFNGYAPSNFAKPGSRMLEVRNVALASLSFPVHELVLPSLKVFGEQVGDGDIEDFCDRLAIFNQAPGISVLLDGQAQEEGAQEWWVCGARFISGPSVAKPVLEISIAGLPSLQSRSVQQAVKTIRVSGASRWSAYDGMGAHFHIALRGEDPRITAVLRYDAVLADQTHPACTVDNIPGASENTDPSDRVDWALFTHKQTTPFRLMSPTTTAHATYTENWNRLNAELLARKSREPKVSCHIGWGENIVLFKFLEHVVRKVRQGAFPLSHAERLCMLDFTWGEGKLSAHQMIHKDLNRSRWHDIGDEDYAY